MVTRAIGLALMAAGALAIRSAAPRPFLGAGSLRRRTRRGIGLAAARNRGAAPRPRAAFPFDIAGAAFVFLTGAALLMASPD